MEPTIMDGRGEKEKSKQFKCFSLLCRKKRRKKDQMSRCLAMRHCCQRTGHTLIRMVSEKNQCRDIQCSLKLTASHNTWWLMQMALSSGTRLNRVHCQVWGKDEDSGDNKVTTSSLNSTHTAHATKAGLCEWHYNHSCHHSCGLHEPAARNWSLKWAALTGTWPCTALGNNCEYNSGSTARPCQNQRECTGR